MSSTCGKAELCILRDRHEDAMSDIAGDCVKKTTCKSTLVCTVLVLGLKGMAQSTGNSGKVAHLLSQSSSRHGLLHTEACNTITLKQGLLLGFAA